ncbi:2-alkenal reductase (NADP(+)-dependent)-like [Cryptomeria japonica]|uniref:2-alkenal reductase (NADP(+)-dependent)-like n=1 Tax=Cryptomeria japonica TaxID=3369 RepID=UPI0027DA52DE|nr:2-alkenal reductase (NADP(+)-dependent)-like [Cryptomeria japonica]
MEKMVRNKQVVLVSYANEGPVTDDHVKIRETQLNLNACKEGEVIVQNLFVSVDPYMRWRMKEEITWRKKEETNWGRYFDNFKLDQPIVSLSVGKVVVSANSGFEVDDLVTGMLEVAEYSIVVSVQGSMLMKLDPNLALPSDYLGPLGMVGMTAWGGLLQLGEPKPGDEVLVSAAAGAVGLLVGQLAEIKGCRVVGSAGSDQKVKMLKEEFGFDDAFNYKSETDLDAALSKYFPRGIDIYFENVGGKMLEAVLNHININARIPVCGMISQYNQEWEKCYGVRNLVNLVGKCAKMQGFLGGMFLNRSEEFIKEMGGYMQQGKIKYKEDVKHGIEIFLEAFNSLFSGGNTGKVLVQLTPN